ncbi:hypothetical protein AB0I61_03630 [Polymorphospora rubra]|uniref:hypothetical protein n=1 Tax=Polymorphospora rubra TaxID=338584 RepID=UPI0033DA7044
MANHRLRPAAALVTALALAGCVPDIPEPDRAERIAAECAAVAAGYETWSASSALPDSQPVADTLGQEQLDQLGREAAAFRDLLQPYQGETVRSLRAAAATVGRVAGEATPGRVGTLLAAVAGVEAAHRSYAAEVCA